MAQDAAYLIATQKIAEAQRLGSTQLDLSGLGLTEIPPALWQLTQLLSLNLGYKYSGAKNQITQLPEHIGVLTRLQEISFSYNQLTSLPDSLRGLTHLRSLNLSFNKLAALPVWLGDLTQLQYLNLAEDFVDTLPASLCALSQLQYLDLYGCRLTTLPVNFAQLRQLQKLHLQGNCLTTLPPRFDALTELHELWLGTDLSGNVLGSFPEVLRPLKKLTVLGIGNCQFAELPDWIEELSALRSLYANYNLLTDLPTSLARLANLEILKLEGNPLNPALAYAYQQGLAAVKQYLQLKK